MPAAPELLDHLLRDDSAAGLPALAAWGVRDPAAAWADLRRILATTVPSRFEPLWRLLERALPENPDPDRALNNLERFQQAAQGPIRPTELAADRPFLAALLLDLFGFSQFMSDVLIRYPHYAAWLGNPATLDARPSEEETRADLLADMATLEDPAARLDAAIRWLRRMLTRLGAQLLLGRIDEVELMRRLSDQASALVHAAIGEARRALEPRFGRPMREDAPDREASFCAIGMGKLGARELNFSSDIDLVYLYSDEGTTTGRPDGTGRISNHEYFRRLSEAVTTFLSAPSGEGYLYRVDTRLRPEGADGPLARSLASFEIYFETQARTWERMAMLKGRAIAGDDDLRAAFEAVGPGVVFGMGYDVSLIERVRELKTTIDSEVERGREAGREIKRGVGGIREIEFLVQTLQLLHGASDHYLRARATLDAIDALESRGRWSREQARSAREDYLFLRVVEHRLQMLNLRQTHTLPDDPDELDSLALRCGIPSAGEGRPGERLLRRRAEVRDRVHARFAKFFGEPKPSAAGRASSPASPAESAARAILSSAPEREILSALAPFAMNSGECVASLRRLSGAGAAAWLGPRGRELAERIMPKLIESASATARPATSLVRLENFLESSGSVASLYEVFAANPNVLALFLRAFALSATWAGAIASSPEWVDCVLDPEYLATTPPAEAIAREVERRAGNAASHEAFASELARAKAFHYMRIGLAETARLFPLEETGSALTTVAEALTRAAFAEASRALGAPLDGFVALAMGKLATRELGHFSDLDLVFGWRDGSPEDEGRLGDAARRLTERAVATLTMATPAGAAFAVDARLRPEGANAPLAPPFSRFSEYYSGRAQLWEMQSMMRARPCGGDPEAGRILVATLLDRVRERLAAMDWTSQVLPEIRRMRAAIQNSVKVPNWALCDFKKGFGGIVDLEFVAQSFQLRATLDGEDWTALAPPRIFARAAESGRLDAELAASMTDDYRFLRRLESRARLLYETDKSQAPAGGEKWDALVRAMRDAAPDEPATDLRERINATLRRNRARFDAILK